VIEMKKKKTKVIALCLLIPVFVIIIGAVAFVSPIIIGYYNNAYESREIAERQEPYIMPETEPQPPEQEQMIVLEDDLGKDLYSTEPQTLENTINNSPSATTSQSKSNRFNYSNSFGRSENAISVYGKTPIYKVEQKDPDIINILILGTDSRDVTKERGRSDSMMVLSYNQKTGAVKIVSILRDSLVPIEGHKWNRINAAYSFDGVGLAVNTVNQLFDLDIQRFVVIDFNGTKDFINHIGGIDITLTEAEAAHYNRNGFMQKEVSAGPCHMDGAMALVYMRTRKVDSDFGRTNRQRTVIETVVKKILSEMSVSEIYDLTDFAFKLVKTNISLTELLPVVGSAATRISGLSIESQHVPYSDSYQYKYYNGMAIISFDIDEAARRINKFLYK